MQLHSDVVSSRSISHFNKLEEKFRRVHGLKYDYSKVIYLKNNLKIIITCPIHGDFEQVSNSHLNGNGCNKCAVKEVSDSQRKTKNQFIDDVIKVHGDKYNYSKVNYVNSQEPVTITCEKHGDFSQNPTTHLQGSGCPSCGLVTRGLKHRNTTEEFISKATAIHGNKYDYSKVVYTKAIKEVIIGCRTHGNFSQTPMSHMSSYGCVKCANVIAGSKLKDTLEEFIVKANKVHNNVYSYVLSKYINSLTKLTIICSTHGEFEQVPSSHISGSGCPKCASHGFNPSKPAYLYYLKVTTSEGRILYKIGITNRSVNERFNLTDLTKIEIIKQKRYEKGTDALNWETKLKRMFKQYQYKGPNILENGNTELFTVDVMVLYKEEKEV